MTTPKQWLQKWLGIEATAIRLSEMDIERYLQKNALTTESTHHVVLNRDIEQGEAVTLEDLKIKKGYERA